MWPAREAKPRSGAALERCAHDSETGFLGFPQDYFRAAQTCIRFFEGTAGGVVTSYDDLYSRLRYLDEAKHHIEIVIAERRSPKGTAMRAGAALRLRSFGSGKLSSAEDPSHLALSLTELTNHLNMITLQIEITNFMHRCTTEGEGVTSLRAGDDGKLPTLFGNGHVRGELSVQVSNVTEDYLP